MTKHTILFLAANPLGTDRLALDQEARAIHVALERSGQREEFVLVTRWAAQPLDLLDELRKLKPTVVHFSGHGGRGIRRMGSNARRDVAHEPGIVDQDYQHGLIFQGSDGRPRLVSAAALEKTFSAAGSSVKLVVLNACYSEVQAEALLAHVDCVVGVTGSISDDGARNFAIGFYGGIGERESVAAAYEQGRAAIILEGLSENDRPLLKVRDGVDAGVLIIADPDIGKRRPVVVRDEIVPQSRGWVWHSTVESVQTGGVSILAMVETVAASSVYAWIAWRFGTLHLAVSACVAPFLLLRTQHSVSLALNWFDLIFKPKPVKAKPHRRHFESDNIEPNPAFDRVNVADARSALVISMLAVPFVTFAYWIICAVPMILLRIVSTVAAVSTRPLESVSQIPRNWWRAIASVDSRYPLELLPGAYRRYRSGEYSGMVHLSLMPGAAVKKWASSGRWAETDVSMWIFHYALVFSIGSAVLLPAWFYRWSLKGAALIYSPLIWIVQGATARSVRTHLQDLDRLVYYRINRWFATFVLAMFAAKVYLRLAWVDLAPWWRTLPGSSFLDAVVMPAAFPPWQLASVVNAILTWALYVGADWVIARWDHGARINEKMIEGMLRWLSLLRGILSVYTIVCCVYLAASLSGRFGLPAMGTRILPWR